MSELYIPYYTGAKQHHPHQRGPMLQFRAMRRALDDGGLDDALEDLGTTAVRDRSRARAKAALNINDYKDHCGSRTPKSGCWKDQCRAPRQYLRHKPGAALSPGLGRIPDGLALQAQAELLRQDVAKILDARPMDDADTVAEITRPVTLIVTDLSGSMASIATPSMIARTLDAMAYPFGHKGAVPALADA